MGLFRSSELLGIAAETLEFILRASEDTHPKEYMGFLRATDTSRKSSPTSATVQEFMRPNNVQSVGSVHSHPNGVLRPSDADLGTFGQGDVHIIVGAPYGRTDWQAFDNDGSPVELDVLDVDLPDDEFFEATQEALEEDAAEGTRVAGTDLADDSEDDEGRSGFLSWLRR
ncbi:proteasome protein [Halobacteriales archaeon QH_6_66_25]|nr:MAG: proteasome protein [Halobacteriales archaeon QH_6_66_25]